MTGVSNLPANRTSYRGTKESPIRLPQCAQSAWRLLSEQQPSLERNNYSPLTRKSNRAFRIWEVNGIRRTTTVVRRVPRNPFVGVVASTADNLITG